MPFASAMARHAVGVAVLAPGQGLQRVPGDDPVHPLRGERARRSGSGPAVLLGISCRLTWQVARIGTPVVPNSVYVTSTRADVGGEAGRGERTPLEHHPRRRGLLGRDARGGHLAAGQERLRPSSARRCCPGSSEVSRKISTVISRGSGPMNSGTEPSRTAAVGAAFHWARRPSWQLRRVEVELEGLHQHAGGGAVADRRFVDREGGTDQAACRRRLCGFPWP